jgi:hypothetical protein
MRKKVQQKSNLSNLLSDILLPIPFVRKLLSATVRQGRSGHFYWIGSDSWGAKIHPVRHQEWAAEGAITILPKRSSLPGTRLKVFSYL